MKLMQKGNKQLRVPDNRLDEMLRRGFVECDPKTGKPTDFIRASARVVETVWLPRVERYEYVRIGAKRSNFVSVVAQVQKNVAWVLSKIKR